MTTEKSMPRDLPGALAQTPRINIRKLWRRGLVLYFLILLACAQDIQAQNWQLVWSDEFEGDTLDTSKWSYQYGTGTSEGLINWGNNELQYYTDRNENIYVADGRLHIVARQESFNNRNYTSARIRTINQGDWKYGRFEIRAKLPEGQGLWPAIWMMPTDNVYGGWAASGEIDIMELLGHEPNRVHGTLHYGGNWPNNVHSGSSYQLSSGTFSDDFHTFTLLWREGEFRWFVNGILYQNQINWYTTGHPYPAPFDERFHMILNVAVGGNWPGNPNHTTVFPQEMVVDYIRIYQDASTTSTEPPGTDRPSSFDLKQNYPNPFASISNIEFTLPRAETVSIDVFDALGRLVANVTDGPYSSGSHSVQFDASRLMNGIYFYRLKAGSHIQFRNMIVAK
jgi:beta-glucanase (GH16 family)